MKSNLVVVRAGGSSLHPAWLELPYEARSYDVILSYFNDDAFAAFTPQPGVEAVLIKGGKWDGLYKTLQGRDLSAYDYVWLPDDDLALPATGVNRLFEMMSEYGLRVAQPALTHNSYYSHFIFMACPSLKLRYTNYIEIMAPCLHREVLAIALPLFEHSMSGFGMDYIWARWDCSGPYRVAILDEVTMHHTRPVGNVLKSQMANSGRKTSEEEEIELKARFNLVRRTVPLVYGGISRDGQALAGRLRMAGAMFGDWQAHKAQFTGKETNWDIFKMLRRQLIKPLDLSVIA